MLQYQGRIRDNIKNNQRVNPKWLIFDKKNIGSFLGTTLQDPPPQKYAKLQYCLEGYNIPLVMVMLGFLTIPWLGK